MGQSLPSFGLIHRGKKDLETRCKTDAQMSASKSPPACQSPKRRNALNSGTSEGVHCTLMKPKKPELIYGRAHKKKNGNTKPEKRQMRGKMGSILTEKVFGRAEKARRTR